MCELEEHRLPGGVVVDLFDQSSVTYGWAPSETFDALTESQQDCIRDGLVEAFSTGTIATHWSDLSEWKTGDIEAMGREESLFAQITAESGPHDDPSGLKIRQKDRFDANWGREERRFAWTVYGLSQSLVRAAVADETDVRDDTVRLFRGIHDKYDVPHVLAAAIENPQCDSFTLPATVLNNYSPCETAAAGYSPIVLEKDVRRTEIILTPDYFLQKRKDGELFTDDGECRVLGTVTAECSSDEISVVIKETSDGEIQDRYTISDFFDPLPRTAGPALEAFARMLEHAGERIKEYAPDDPFPREKILVTSPDGVERLEEWYAAARSELKSRSSPQIPELLHQLTDDRVNIA